MRVVRGAAAVVVLGLVAALPADAQDAPPVAPPGKPEFKPPAILAQRRKGTGDRAADAAIAAGRDWLRRHQSDDGRWDAHTSRCVGAPCGGVSLKVYEPGITALAVLAFLGAGRTHVDGEDAVRLRLALESVARSPGPGGPLDPRAGSRFPYAHSLVTSALAEALWLTGDASLREPVERARDHLLSARLPAGWSYATVIPESETPLNAYAVTALRTCELAGLDVQDDAYSGAREWFRSRTDARTGRCGYSKCGGDDAIAWRDGDDVRTSPTDPARRLPADVAARFRKVSSSCTAAAGFALSFCGDRTDAPVVLAASDHVLDRQPPRFLDLHLYLFGGLVQAQRPEANRPTPRRASDVTWPEWRKRAVADLLARQVGDGTCAKGSWNPDEDPFGVAGGRVYATAMAVLALQAPTRFPRVWDRTKSAK